MQNPDDLARHERESVDRQLREPYPAGTPHHSSVNSLPLHQPVASRLAGAIHSPGGLLANHGSSGSSVPLGGPPGPSNTFGPPLHEANRGPPPAVGQGPPQSGGQGQHQMFAPLGHHPMPPSAPLGPTAGPPPSSVFGGPLQPDNARPPPLQQMQYGGNSVGPGAGGPPPPPMQGGNAIAPGPGPGPGPSSGQGGIAQGQQPILNDALSYLDQVKVQFADQADVYNRFLDIMKDFKSQTIDTPGVINRVSELFAGHPNLIQGFNTFLPPGYRIECGAGNDPNSIRVTTPMGTSIQSIGAGRNQVDGPPGPGSQYFNNQRHGGWQQSGQHGDESMPGMYGPGHGPNQQPGSAYDGPGQPHPPPRGSSQVPTNPSNHAAGRNAHTPTPGGPGAMNGGNHPTQQGSSMEKRGPVEFNHAISYVNKIKNRFQDKPEIYKNFLEILQTYQREQKPIQEVYAQVTTLFHSAPDLLEDFKQFLPESAAQGKAPPPRPADESMAQSSAGHGATPSHGRDSQKLPPVGSFAPPSASKESKKRPRPDKVPPPPPPALPEPVAPPPGPRTIPGVATAGNKRQKLVQQQQQQPQKPLTETPVIEPTLTPVHPEPLPPTTRTAATADELAFFERVRKYFGNKSVFGEFLKLCNLFNQQLIDRDVLIYKAAQFLGNNAELMNTFKQMVSYKTEDEPVENKPEPPTGKVSLSNCRGYGPSYRLLPKRERLKPCSGRDELCNSVLNDEWASHPTWASEDSGFVAHRKNAFEEGLHRIEEERHDYDFHIEANQKCIQLLEPIAQQMLALSPRERETFVMPPGLGGQSTSIYKRVLKKIYGPERGAQVVNDMFSDPFAVVPVVLARLKQRDEDWRFTQREWQKIWAANTEAMHLKSLDHMGIMVKQTDKRNLSAKHLVDVIKTKYEEQRRIRAGKGSAPRYQLTFSFPDRDLILDLLRFMLIYAQNNGQHSQSEKERIAEFFETIMTSFFGISDELVQSRIQDIERDAADEDADDAVPPELTNGRSRRGGKKSDLLRGVLDPSRSGNKARGQKEDSAVSGSKETTPDVGSANEDEELPDAPEDANGAAGAANDRWLPAVPGPIVLSGDNPLLDSDGELKADGPFRRPWYNFFCNQTIYVFFSIVHTLYQRLRDTKGSDDQVDEEIRRMKTHRPAHDLGFAVPEENFFEGVRSGEYWTRTAELIEDYLHGEVEENKYQDILRKYYLKNGWKLYTIQDLLKTLCRLSLTCTSSDSKEKTPDLIHQFIVSRQQEETSYQAEIAMRKFAEKCIKDGDMFVISWFPTKNEATVRWLQRDETTFYMDEMELKDRWQYYISSFVRVEPTEGINRSRMQKTVLTRNLPSSDADSEDGMVPAPLAYDESLTLRICLNSSKIVWEKGTSEWYIFNTPPDNEKEAAEREERIAAGRELRKQKFIEKMVMNSAWMRDMTQDEVRKINEDFQKWIKDGIPPAAEKNGDEAASK